MSMRAPGLEFLPPSRWARHGGQVLLALGLAACAAVALRYGQAADAQAAALARLHPPPAATVAAVPPAQAADMQAAQAVSAALNVPWDAWFRALESVAVPGVALTALQPEGGSRRARLTGQATTLAQALAYVDALERSPGFGQVLLVDHAVQEDLRSAALRFTLTAEWEGP